MKAIDNLSPQTGDAMQGKPRQRKRTSGITSSIGITQGKLSLIDGRVKK